MNDPGTGSDVWLRDGRLHIPRAIHEQQLSGCEAIALLARDGGWQLVPLRAGAGGLQVKLRNAQGDRVVESQEFFRHQGIEDDPVARRLRLVDLPGEGAYALVADPPPGN